MPHPDRKPEGRAADQTLVQPSVVPPSRAAEVAATPESVTDNERVPSAPDGTLLTSGASAPRLGEPLPLPSSSPPGYEIFGELGRGGMGVVYKARQTGLNRLVALKMILHADHAGTEERQRFQTEAEAIAHLQHPNIVQVYEVGEHHGLPYFSLEFCDGGTLTGQLQGSPLEPRRAALLVEVLARAMHAAHQKGVLHRDLKPANVLLTADGTPKISDFGLAKRLDEAGQTQSGSIMGTASYMAPEQATGKIKEIGPATDLYALGATLYECLVGRPPFRAATSLETIRQVVNEEVVPPRRLQPKTPPDLETICLKCLQKEANKRYGSAEELAEDLRRFLAGEPIKARRVGALERGWRWCRRNPALAVSVGVVAVCLLATTAVSMLFGLSAEQARRDEAARARSEATAKEEAEQARRDAQRKLIDLCGASGVTAAREQDHSLALLWFARAAQLARGEPQQEELNRIRVANWLRQVCLPEGMFTMPGFRQVQDHFRTLEFSPDGKYLLVVASTGDCLVWDRQHARSVLLPKAAAKGMAAAWQPRSGVLAVAEKEGPIRFLAPPEFRPVGEVAPSGEVTVLAFSRDGKRLAWGGTDGARVWDREKNEYVTPLLAHGGSVISLSFGVGGKLLVTAARDFRARVFRIAPNQPDPVFLPVEHQPGQPERVYSPESEQIAPRFIDDDQIIVTAAGRLAGSRLNWRAATTGQVLMSADVPYQPFQGDLGSC